MDVVSSSLRRVYKMAKKAQSLGPASETKCHRWHDWLANRQHPKVVSGTKAVPVAGQPVHAVHSYFPGIPETTGPLDVVDSA
jgi:hypothetical protein